MNLHEGVGHDYEAGLLAPKRSYHRFDFSIAADAGRDRLYRQQSGSGFERRDLLEHLQPLAPHPRLREEEASDIPTRAGEAFNEAFADRVGNGPKYYRDRLCFPPQRGGHRG